MAKKLVEEGMRSALTLCRSSDAVILGKATCSTTSRRLSGVGHTRRYVLRVWVARATVRNRRKLPSKQSPARAPPLPLHAPQVS